jgi:ParB family transcriptional regulator, chromosome partitioning protein
MIQGRDSIYFINVNIIGPNKNQPRRSFDSTGLQQLADSIKHAGVMQPVILRRDAVDSGRYELVAGERRWRAAALAGLASIPSIVHELDDEQSAEWALVENLQREDLNPIDRADALKNLADRFGLSHAQIAEKVGLDRSSVANFIRLADLEPQIREYLASGKLSAGHGKALLAMPAGLPRVRLAAKAVEEQWSVRRLEQAARPAAIASLPGSRSASAMISAEEAQRKDLERQLGDYLGTKVELQSSGTNGRGRITIQFYGLEHFDGVLARIGFRPK